MILLTRLDRAAILVNTDLVMTVEQTPDTKLTFTNGEHLLVREPPAELIRRLIEFKQQIHSGALLVPPPA